MKIVAIDTATDDTVAGARDGSEMTFGFVEGPDGKSRPRHSHSVLEAAEAAAASLGGWGSVDRIAVGLGPGTFTGIRIGIATARGLALGTGIPATGFSTLDALSAVPAGVESDSFRLAVIDARRGEAFAALYRPDGSSEWPAAVYSPEALCERVAGLGRPVIAGGSGAIRFSDELNEAGATVPGTEAGIHRLSPDSICETGATAGSTDPLEPIYLRLPDAQLWLQRDGK